VVRQHKFWHKSTSSAEHDIAADVVVGPFGEYLFVDACPVGAVRKVIATGRTTLANPEGATR
jgi:hypothetical protein